MTGFVRNSAISALCSSVMVSSVSFAATPSGNEAAALEQVIVQGVMTANNQPVGTYSSPISNLEYDPRIDLQSRNMAESQADVTIRGGIFEGTGFRVGSATLMDPQTGHYFAEIPIAPEMLSKPDVFTGADNALYGFNSSVGTIDYTWQPVRDGGSLSAAAGNNALNVQRLHGAMTTELDTTENWTLGVEAEYSRSASDGTTEHGDHDYDRASARVQLLSDSSQTDLFFGYQSKFFGWTNMYTPFNVNETEDIETKLLMLNHQQRYGKDNQFEVSAYYRRNNDHYVFSRENPAKFQAFHETSVKALAVSGRHGINEALALNYSAQLTADSIDSTTLENNFTSRNYTKVSVLPEYRYAVQNNQWLTLRLGAAFDDTNRDDSQVSAIADVSWLISHSNTRSETFYLSYAEASQVVGYIAIGGSETGGLFRSNHDLGRETTKNLELGTKLKRDDWSLDAALFYRWDNELSDWTYSLSSTSARSANPVDIKTLGLELIAIKRFESADIVASYTHLKKSEDYGNASVDASFYALNYPDHRLTLGAIWRPLSSVEIRVDNEWRQQQENSLRKSDDDAFFTHLTASYFPSQVEGLELKFAIDNLWDESFEEVPGTPGRGDQYSLGLTYRW